MILSGLTISGGQLLRAEAAPGTPDDRIREGLLVPWNEDGRTNLGPGFPVRPSFAAGLEGSRVVGIYGHNREAAVSALLNYEVRPAGLWGRIFVNRTALGDQLLAEIDGGARRGLSIEASELVLDDAGGVVSGRMDFVAHVPKGAYDSALVHHRTLAATVTTTNGAPPVTLPAPGLLPAPVPAAPAPVLQANLTPQAQAPVPAPVVPAPAAPVPAASVADQLATLLAGLTPAAPAPVAPPAAEPITMATLLAALQAQGIGQSAPAAPAGPSAAALLGTPGIPATPANGGPEVDPIHQAAVLQAGLSNGDYTLQAALQDITHSGLPMFQRPAGTIGTKLWEGSQTARRWVDLTDTSTPLTSMKYTTWQWTRGPEVKAWTGDKTEVPSNPVTLEEIPGTARRCAGGWDVDRAYRDFGTTEFWTEFYKEQTESYRELTNLWASEALVGFARDISVDGNVPASYLDVDRTIDAGPTQILRAAALGTAILEDTPKVRQGPDWVAMNTADWLTLVDLTNLDLPSFMALLKIEPGNFMRTAEVPQGQVILGVKRAAKTRELGGGAPIRVEALDVARGGIDSAVYGYVGYSLERPGGIISVPLAAAA